LEIRRNDETGKIVWSKRGAIRPDAGQPSYGVFDAKKCEKQDRAVPDVLPLWSPARLQKWACRRQRPEILPKMLEKTDFVRCPVAAQIDRLKPDFLSKSVPAKYAYFSQLLFQDEKSPLFWHLKMVFYSI
jgi:hypothetical protein